MRDLQRRLGASGLLPALGSEAGHFGALTRQAVEQFQARRGLRITGVCDETTWTALVEESWRLGSRSLMLRSPNMRGDDVAELQTLLARLGFDCGRVDGILGPNTSRALVQLQTSAGLAPDGVCGVETVAVLRRLCRQTGEGPGVAAVRELEMLRSTERSLPGHKIVVGQFGGLSALTREVIRGLRRMGAHVVGADEPDPSVQAATANRFEAHLYLGFEGHADPSASIAYYAVPGFESAGGRLLAERLLECLEPVFDGPVEHVGMRVPVLRETRMPAVLCTVGPVRSVVDHAPQLADAVILAVAHWVQRPISSSS